jgi:putative hydrolase of the HAD superfamily
MAETFRAVIFDLGGVVFPSPFEAFDAYDTDTGLPPGSVRALIRTSSEEGAWAALERGELAMDEFFAALELEAEANGFRLDARELMQSVATGFGPRPAMLRAIARIRARGLRTAALTNNWPAAEDAARSERFAELQFDVVVESAVEGLRKPDPRIYELVLERLGVRAADAVFLDDLGINLKPARALGMTTIKVTDPEIALAELAHTLGFDLDVPRWSDSLAEHE